VHVQPKHHGHTGTSPGNSIAARSPLGSRATEKGKPHQCVAAFPAATAAGKASAVSLHGKGSTNEVRQSSRRRIEENRVRGGASHRRRRRRGGGTWFPVRTRALRVIFLDTRQGCDEEVPFCSQNPQECGARTSSPAGSFGGGKASMTRQWGDSSWLAPAQPEKGG
jgi:hypothetical protein